MRLSIFNKNDCVLVLGEGNFSFSTSLCKHNLNINLTSSCYEKEPFNEIADENIKFLRENGTIVLLGIDATKISETNEQIKGKLFDKIIFNFPHVNSKMRLDLNRKLIQEFFKSAKDFLKPDGFIVISLCNGQGGTNFDNPQRKFNDSWKVKELSAHSNFILTAVELFDYSNFYEYKNTGFRGLDKHFLNKDSRVHIFKHFGPIHYVYFIPNELIHLDKFNNCELIHWNDIVKNNMRDFFGPPYYNFDITFLVTSDFSVLQFFIVLYNNLGNIINNVELIRTYQFPNSQKISKTFRITYHSDTIPLYRQRVIEIHENIIPNILKNKLNTIL